MTLREATEKVAAMWPGRTVAVIANGWLHLSRGEVDLSYRASIFATSSHEIIERQLNARSIDTLLAMCELASSTAQDDVELST